MVDTMTIYHRFNNYNEYKEAFDVVDKYIKKFKPNALLRSTL